MKLRIGVNLGDVLVEGDDIFGNGVNIAARLEAAAAEPGAIYLSSEAHRQVRQAMNADFEDLGERGLKNIPEPVRIYRLRPVPEQSSVADCSLDWMNVPRPTPPADQPSIIVLPFENFSQDPEQTFFSDGITEDIITDLSKIPGLFVIARNTAFTYRGRALNLVRLCQDLGVRYALEGSVRKLGRNVRITAQLIDGATGGHVWADRYDRDLTAIFAVQDEVTRGIVSALKVKLTPEEARRLEGRGTANVEAYECFLRGRELSQRRTQADIAVARPYFDRAIDLDPSFACAYAGLAFCHAVEYVNQLSSSDSLKTAFRLARQAVSFDPNEPQAFYALAMTHLWRHEHVDATTAARKATTLDPNFAPGYSLLGLILHYAGSSREGADQLNRAMQLDPYYPDAYLHFLAQCEFSLQNYHKATVTLRRRLVRNPDSDISRVLLACCHGHLGESEDARTQWREALRINPHYSLEHRRQVLPYKDASEIEHFTAGLRKAGLVI
jgi:TolB-like protein/Tfp pilus assembly protein PilF